MRSVITVLLAVLAVTGAAIPTPDQYRVKGLEKFGATGKPKANGPEKLVVWLNGGPGCSSMIGMMHEHGPFTIEPAAAGAKAGLKYDLKRNPYSWSEVTNVLYVEQPIRTGFAVAAEGAGPIKDETQVAADFRNFLISFMDVFTQYKGAEMYISGESYAGFYVPWIAEHVVKMQLVPNQQGVMVRDTSIDGLNLAGVAIGNGVMDMYFQEPSYAEYAYYHGLIPLGAKQKFERDWASCMELIESRGEVITRGSFEECDMMGKVLEAAGLPNEYNTATFIQYAPIIGPGSTFDAFFQDPEIQEILHVRGYDLPGLNFVPEAPPVTKPAPSRRLQTSTVVNAAAGSAAVNAEVNSVVGSSHGAGTEAVASQVGLVAAVDMGVHTDAAASAAGKGDAAKSKGKYYAPPHGWGACNDDIDESMAADHPVSVVSNLQFLSQVTPISAAAPAAPTAPAAGTTTAPPASAPAAPAKPTEPSKPTKTGPKRQLTTAEGEVSATESNLRTSAPLHADAQSSAGAAMSTADATIIDAAQSTGNWLYSWWDATKSTLSQLPTSSGPVLSPGPVGSTPVPAPAPVSASAPVKAPKSAPAPVLHVPKPVVPPTATESPASVAPVVPAVPAVPVVSAAATPSHAIRVLLYSGEFDLNCNTLGVLHTLEANRWRNKPWFMAERSLWKYGNDIAGEYLSMDEMFSFLIVRNSGHLLPKDLPAIGLELIDRFINQRSFADQPLPSEQSYMVQVEDANIDALHMQADNPTVQGAEPNVGTAGGVILALVLIVAVLSRVYKFGSKEAGAPQGGLFGNPAITTGAFGGVALSNTHAYTPIPSAESDYGHAGY